MPDALSRWAYPASEAYKERSKHGTIEDAREMEEIIRAEREIERKLEEKQEIRFLQIQMVTRQSSKQQVPPKTRHSDPEIPQQAPEPVLPPVPPIPPAPASLIVPAAPIDPVPAQGNQSVLDMDWAPEYSKCPKWSEAWAKVTNAQQHGGKGPWPKGFQFEKNRLIFEGKWCVPQGLTAKILRAHHSETGHARGERLMTEAARFFCIFRSCSGTSNFKGNPKGM